MVVTALRRRPQFPSFNDALANYASKPPFNVARADALHAYVRHGFVAGEDGAVHLACRPEDEAQVFRSAGAHRGFERPRRGAVPGRRGVRRGAGGPGAPSQRPSPRPSRTAGWSATRT